MVNGTGVNGSGKLNCDAAAVSTATKPTDSTCTLVHTLGGPGAHAHLIEDRRRVRDEGA